MGFALRVLIPLFFLGIVAHSVLGQNTRFHSFSVNLVGNDLVAKFDERGIGTGPVTVELSADVTTEWGCINRGGKNPNAANKQSNTNFESEQEEFQPRGGRITGTLRLDGPDENDDVPEDLDCPQSMFPALISFSFSNVQLCDIDNSLCADLPVTDFSRVLLEGV